MWDVYAPSSSTAAPSTLSSVTSFMPASRMDNLLTSNLWGRTELHFLRLRNWKQQRPQTQKTSGAQSFCQRKCCQPYWQADTQKRAVPAHEKAGSDYVKCFVFSSRHADACTFYLPRLCLGSWFKKLGTCGAYCSDPRGQLPGGSGHHWRMGLGGPSKCKA